MAISRFFILTFAITWIGSAIALNADFETTGFPLQAFRTVLLLAGTFAPSLVAIGLTAQEKGAPGVHALLLRMFHAHVGIRWYLFALGYMAAIYTGVGILTRLSTGGGLSVSGEVGVALLTAIVIALPVHAGEEIGWRGYALPRLADRFGFARASLILGLVWACWHLPLFYSSIRPMYSFPVYTLAVIAMSVAMMWLYVHTNGSLLLATLMHWAMNQTMRIAPLRLDNPENPMAMSRSPEEWMALALLWIAAAYFLLQLHRRVDAVSRDAIAR